MENQINPEFLAQFKECVVSDIKNSEPNSEITEYLHQNLDFWLYTLKTLRRDVELQISCQNAKLKMDATSINESLEIDVDQKQSKISELRVKHHKWRMSILKFLTHIEMKTLYVKMLLNQNKNNLYMEA